MGFSSDRPNFPDSGSATDRAGKRTWSFHERYASDAEFKRQIDEGQRRSKEKRELAALKNALSMPQRREKLY